MKNIYPLRPMVISPHPDILDFEHVQRTIRKHEKFLRSMREYRGYWRKYYRRYVYPSNGCPSIGASESVTL